MYRTLSQHPSIVKPVLHKGVHYFDVGYHHGPSWYRAHFPTQWTADRLRARTGVMPQTFESSPYYLFHPLSPQRIAHDLPGVRVITLLRDPVERAYSAHTHERARGFETATFEEALELEDSRLEGEEERLVNDPLYVSHAHQHRGYVGRGRYVVQLERMVAAVGRDNLLVLDAEDFFTNPELVWRETLEFLRLPTGEPPIFERHNARPRAAMGESVHAALAERFRDTDEQLTQWWGRVPSWCR